MAEFQLSFENTMKFEDSVPSGRVTDEPNGGKARFGINSEAHKMPDSFWTGPAAEQILVARAVFFAGYWVPIRGDEIKSQAIANKLFDMAVNMGVGQGVKLCQEGMNDMSTSLGILAIDGFMGPKTLVAINNLYDGHLLNVLRRESKYFYIDLCEREPNHKPFLEDYLERAAA